MIVLNIFHLLHDMMFIFIFFLFWLFISRADGLVNNRKLLFRRTMRRCVVFYRSIDEFFFLNDFDLSENHNVFTDKREAFLLLKTHKEARLKEFKTNEEAANFSKNGIAALPVNTTMSSCM